MVNFIPKSPDANIDTPGKNYWTCKITPKVKPEENLDLRCNEEMPPSDNEEPKLGKNMVNYK